MIKIEEFKEFEEFEIFKVTFNIDDYETITAFYTDNKATYIVYRNISGATHVKHILECLYSGKVVEELYFNSLHYEHVQGVLNREDVSVSSN